MNFEKSLITADEFASLKRISKKYDLSKVEDSILRAHHDLRNLLGSAFFFDIIANQNEDQYQELLNGTDFEAYSMFFEHEGLKSLLADFAYSRYLYEINVNHSPFGLTVKNSTDSEPVDRNMIKDLVKQNNQDADEKWKLIKLYLETSIPEFTIWKTQDDVDFDSSSQGSRFSQTRFNFIKSKNNRNLC